MFPNQAMKYVRHTSSRHRGCIGAALLTGGIFSLEREQLGGPSITLEQAIRVSRAAVWYSLACGLVQCGLSTIPHLCLCDTLNNAVDCIRLSWYRNIAHADFHAHSGSRGMCRWSGQHGTYPGYCPDLCRSKKCEKKFFPCTVQ